MNLKNNLSLIFRQNSDYKYCYKCRHFSKNPNLVKFKKKFPFFYFKYWKFILYKYNVKSVDAEGVCQITVLGPDGQVNIKTHGNEKCLWDDVQDEIQNFHITPENITKKKKRQKDNESVNS